MLRAADLLSSLSRNSPLARKKDLFLTRAKDKKGGKGAAPEKPKVYVDVSDAPLGRTVARLAYFWNRFALREGDKPVKIEPPNWKVGEEPRWFKELSLPYETIVDPVAQLDPKVIGPKKYLKAIRRHKIKEFNVAIGSKDFSVLKRGQKQLPP